MLEGEPLTPGSLGQSGRKAQVQCWVYHLGKKGPLTVGFSTTKASGLDQPALQQLKKEEMLHVLKDQ